MSQFVRETPRYAMELAVRVRCATWADYLELYTTNLSRGGVFVASQVSAPIGTEMLVQLSLPNGSTLELRAEVVHLSTVEDTGAGRPPGMGLMFVDLDAETRQALEAMVTVARFTTRTSGEPAPAEAPPPASEPALVIDPAEAAPPESEEAAALELDPAESLEAETLEPDALELEPSEPSEPAARPTSTVARPQQHAPAAAPPPPPAGARQPLFGNVVEQSLFNELARRLELKPHEQLGVELEATSEQIAEAHKKLVERYQPVIFARYGAATREVVRKINEQIDAACHALRDEKQRRTPGETAPRPAPAESSPEELEQKARGEEARRALKATIERRVEEACRHRDLGELDEAIRGFEAVLALDRKNDYARSELKLLRERRTQRDQNPSLIDRLLKR
jgi:uncharacterized protein (TIGR02266 family)